MHFPKQNWLKQNWQYLIGAALLHGLFVGLFAVTMIALPREVPAPQLAIQAVIVDQSLISAASRQEREQRQKEQAQAREREQAEDRRKQQLAEQQAAEQRAELERQVQLKQRQEEEQRRQAEEQQLRDRQETERQREAEVERQRQEEAERQRRAEAERKRLAEIERKQKEEAERRKAAQEARDLAARESELQRQLAEEEGRMQAENAGLLNQYAALIEQRIVRNWNRPPSARSGLDCEVKVAQTPTGTVLSVEVGKCNGDAAVRQSIEAAVLRSSPLPPPPDPRLFERNLLLRFRPAD